jgi:hypothetical protein
MLGKNWSKQLPSQGNWRAFCCVLACLAAGGCGSGLTLAPVSGRVRVDGQPVTSGTIMFHPASGPAAVGTIQSDGTYTLATLRPGDGAVVGTHRVTIHATAVGAGTLVEPKTLDDEIKLAQKKAPGGKIFAAGKVTWIVPEKYARLETTPLTRNIEAGANRFDFELSRKE